MIALEHSVVSQHCGDPKPIISKDILPALGLNVAMDLIVAPRLDGGFVPPERERAPLNARETAAQMLKRRPAATRSFNRPIHYPKLYY
jgi:hypothetical protein